VLVGIINIVDIILYCHNQAHFRNKIVNFHSTVNRICASVNITGSSLKSTFFASIHEFQILKAFAIKLHPPNAPKIKEVY
jgi:hypothetical protein